MNPDTVGRVLPEIVVRLDGPLCSPDAYRVFEQMSDLLMHNAPIRLILDLRGISEVDATGLGELMRVHSLADERNSICQLTSVPSEVQQLLSITAYDQNLHVVESGSAQPSI